MNYVEPDTKSCICNKKHIGGWRVTLLVIFIFSKGEFSCG